MCIKEMEEEELRSADMAFSVPSSTGQEIHLSNKYSRITPENKSEYIRLAMNYRYSLPYWGIGGGGYTFRSN